MSRIAKIITEVFQNLDDQKITVQTYCKIDQEINNIDKIDVADLMSLITSLVLRHKTFRKKHFR